MNLPALNLKNKSFREGYSFALDIGTSSIKLCKLKISKEAAQLCDFYLVPVSASPLEALKSAASHMDAKFINIAVCGPATIIRYVSFPRMSQDDLRKALKFEAQKFIPFPAAEVHLDAVILKPDLPDNKMLVSIAAVKKDFISQRLRLLQDSDFKTSIIDLDSLALINAFNFSYAKDIGSRPKSLALVNIGATFTNLNILEESTPFLSRDIDIAGNNFTQNIADNFAIDFKSAEQIKINPDKDKIEKIAQSVESVLSGLATEIRVSFDYYESQSASSVAKIFLTGGGSLLLGLKDTLANILGVEVEYWDPLRYIGIAGNLDAAALKKISSQLSVALGLAMRV